jgi:hypothetical protein
MTIIARRKTGSMGQDKGKFHPSMLFNYIKYDTLNGLDATLKGFISSPSRCLSQVRG